MLTKLGGDIRLIIGIICPRGWKGVYVAAKNMVETSPLFPKYAHSLRA